MSATGRRPLVIDTSARLNLTARGAALRALSGRYSSAVHSIPEPSGSAGFNARNMKRRAPNERVARMTTVLMPAILLSGRRRVIVWSARRIQAAVGVPRLIPAGGRRDKPSTCSRAAAQAAVTVSCADGASGAKKRNHDAKPAPCLVWSLGVEI